MLKSNCKKANENIRKYISDHVNFEDDERFQYIQDIERDVEHGFRNGDLFSVYAQAIYEVFHKEMVEHNRTNVPQYKLFVKWCQGLPLVLDTCYYVNRSAIDDLAKILEESDSEKYRYTEEQAEQKLTWLIWREITRVVKVSTL